MASRYVVDVADAAAVEQVVGQIESEVGPIDIWVNCAFTSVFAEFRKIEPEEFRRVTEVTYLGYVYSTMAVLRRMRARDHGTIVQVGSALAYRGIPLQTAYCAAKHAIQGFMSRCAASFSMITVGCTSPWFSYLRMRRLLRDVAENRELGDTTTLADPTVVEEIKDRAGIEAGNE